MCGIRFMIIMIEVDEEVAEKLGGGDGDGHWGV